VVEGEAGCHKEVLTRKLTDYLERLKRRVGIGYEVKVKWFPGAVKYHDGKRLEEEVVGDNILIYSKDERDALKLLIHGFAEWILNQHTKPYRQLINSFITLFEEQQYERKEKIVEALAKLMEEIAAHNCVSTSLNES